MYYKTALRLVGRYKSVKDFVDTAMLSINDFRQKKSWRLLNYCLWQCTSFIEVRRRCCLLWFRTWFFFLFTFCRKMFFCELWVGKMKFHHGWPTFGKMLMVTTGKNPLLAAFWKKSFQHPWPHCLFLMKIITKR